MARVYSLDLRERVVARVTAGESCRAVAMLFQVSVASVVRWSQRYRRTGSAAAKRMGGRPGLQLAPQQEWVVARLVAAPDLTLRALVAELQAQGFAASYGSVWRVVHAAGISFKKNTVRGRAGPARRRPPKGTLEALSKPA